MPNWTYNSIRIKKNECSPEMWATIQKAANEACGDGNEDFFQAIYPCPQELIETKSAYLSGKEGEELAIKQQENIRKYGHKDWYDWRTNRWGTKWDLCEFECNEVNDEEVSVSGNTAWAFPEGFLDFLVEHGCDVECYFTNEDYDGKHKYENGEVYTKHFLFEAKLPFETNTELLGNHDFQLSDGIFTWQNEVKSTYEAATALINANILRPEDITTIMNNANFDYGEHDTINEAFLSYVSENFYDDDDSVAGLLAELNEVCDPKYVSFRYRFEEYL